MKQNKDKRRTKKTKKNKKNKTIKNIKGGSGSGLFQRFNLFGKKSRANQHVEPVPGFPLPGEYKGIYKVAEVGPLHVEANATAFNANKVRNEFEELKKQKNVLDQRGKAFNERDQREKSLEEREKLLEERVKEYNGNLLKTRSVYNHLAILFEKNLRSVRSLNDTLKKSLNDIKEMTPEFKKFAISVLESHNLSVREYNLVSAFFEEKLEDPQVSDLDKKVLQNLLEDVKKLSEKQPLIELKLPDLVAPGTKM